ncbi:MAG: SLBB domain-containing protein [Terriglobales bacterium]
MKNYLNHVHISGGLLPIMLVLLTIATFGRPLLAQNQSEEQPPYYDRTKAVPQDKSRAQQEADTLVSLSADQIISLLGQEPGLFLECKKVLVRTAYQQGRVIDPGDLTDAAVFRLVQEDEHVRVLFTREIEDRYYVRVKPTREELDRLRKEGKIQLPDATTAQATANDLKEAKNQEQAYWLRHERDLEPSLSPSGVPAQGSTAAPNYGVTPGYGQAPGYRPETEVPQPLGPQQYPSTDPRRSLLLAQGQSPDTFDSGSDDSTGMSRIGADQLSRLMDTRTDAGSGFGGGDSSGDALSPMGRGFDMGGVMGGGIGMSGFDALSLGSLTGGDFGQDAYPGGNGALSQQGRLDTRQSALYPPYSRRRWDLRDKQPALRHRPNPYADVPSLYDLYAQYSRRSPKLDRFGIDIFERGTGNLDQLPMDMPVGPDYVLGPGDGLNINLFGAVSERLRKVVDREGKVILPEVGGVQVSGRTLGDVQQMVQAALRTEYRDVQADVSLSRLRAIRVYVVGDVQSPGAYQVSSLSTPLNAVFEAGGPTSRGSLRILNHYRGKQLLEKVDVYDLLLSGVNSNMQRLEAGDTIQVPPLGPEVTVQGMVRRPAIYELNGEQSLSEVLEVAGGVLPSGTLRHVDVERVEAHESRSMLRLDIPENNNQQEVTKALDDFKIQDGDKIQISPILPYAEKTVYLDGYVFRPGKFAYRDGMKVTDLIKSYKDILPEPYKQHAEIIRLSGPENTPQVIAFNLEDALAGNDQDLVLKPFDTVRVFGRFDFEDTPIVTVTGEVRDPGDHVTNGVIHLRDAIYMAGNTTADAQLDNVQVFRKTEQGELKVISVNLTNALAGDAKDDILLEPKDRVIVHRNLTKVDPPTVTIEGEVARTGKYPLGDDLTAAGLVRFAGGFKRGAYTEEADLTSYMVENGSKIVSDHRTVQIARALAGEPDTDVRLHDGDVLTIRQLSGWNDLGATITVNGEVLHAGAYGIQAGERLSSIIKRAGGFSPDAYPYGVVFQRAQIRELEEKNRADLIQRIKSEESAVRVLPTQENEDTVAKQAAVSQYQATLEKLQNVPPAGRLVIHISSNIKNWANTSADITVRAGDSIYIPKRPGIVIVNGAVYNPTGITYKPGKNAGWYLSQAGGPTEEANKKAVFVIRGDGSVVGGKGGMFSGGVESAELRPGDMVVVPERIYAISRRWQNTVQAAQVLTSVAIAVGAARTF